MQQPAVVIAGMALVALLVLAWSYAALRTEFRNLQRTFHTELDRVRAEQAELATREAAVQLEAWKRGAEAELRQDAIRRSQSVIVGKVTEHLTPYLPEFAWNPKDARFIGSPVDFLVFDGLDEGTLREVAFVEVKTGGSALTRREQQVRDAIGSGRVRWRELRIGRGDAPAVSPPDAPLSWSARIWRRLSS